MNNNDYEVASQRHLRNLKRSINQSGNGSIRYEYILSNEQLIDSYLTRLDTLGYPLKVEPKRDRYVLNKQVMKEAIQQATTQALQDYAQHIYVFLSNDVSNLIEKNAYSILNEVFTLDSQATHTQDKAGE